MSFSGWVVKNLPAIASGAGDRSLIPGVGNGNPLQYYYFRKPMDRGAWWAIVYGITKSLTQLSMHAYRKRTQKRLIEIIWTWYFSLKCLFLLCFVLFTCHIYWKTTIHLSRAKLIKKINSKNDVYAMQKRFQIRIQIFNYWKSMLSQSLTITGIVI